MGNIAIFIPSIKSGGAEKQAVLLAEVLAGEHNVHFISFYGTSNASHSNMAVSYTHLDVYKRQGQ